MGLNGSDLRLFMPLTLRKRDGVVHLFASHFMLLRFVESCSVLEDTLY